MSSQVDLYALQSLNGVGDQAIRKIIRDNLSVSDLIHLKDGDLKKYFSTGKAIDSFRNDFLIAQEKAEYEIERFKNNGIEIIDFFNDYYPKNLAKIDDFPIILYCIGNKNLLLENKNIAVIGTRDNSEVGQQIARNTAYYFAQNGYTIVSGLAKGIDGIAHKAALEAKGKTIAVLVDVSNIYPKENSTLAKDIINNNGLLISENKPGTFQAKSSFVLRDRIQSGLSLAIFPIETDIVGGTMHTVKFAQKQNRKIFVPDVFNLAIRSRYESSVGSSFSKINGIKELINTKLAIPYTKETYESVQSLLNTVNNALQSFHGLLDNKIEMKETTLFNSKTIENNEIEIENKNITSNDKIDMSIDIIPNDNYIGHEFTQRVQFIDEIKAESESIMDLQLNNSTINKPVFTKDELKLAVLVSEFNRKFGNLMETDESIISNKIEMVAAIHDLSKNLKSVLKEKKNNRKDKGLGDPKKYSNNEIFPD